MAVNFAKLPRLAERTTTARRPPRAAPAVPAGAFCLRALPLQNDDWGNFPGRIPHRRPPIIL